MAILIEKVKALPNQIPGSTTTPVTVTFTGSALTNNSTVDIDFTISPFPKLDLNGSQTDKDTYIFSTTPAQFTKKLNITSQDPSLPVSLKGMVALLGTEQNTGDTAPGNDAILYQ